MKKRILIYYHENKLAPIGGPAGYLYNLKKQIDQDLDEDLQIEFLPPVESKNVAHSFLKKYVPARGQEFVRALNMTRLYQKETGLDEKYLNYDAIHFHSTEDLYFCRRFLEKYKGTVLLTSHTPCVSFVEKLDRLNSFDRKLFAKQLESLKRIDEYAFKRANYVIFPCEEAEEPYYHTWKEYKAIRDPQKYTYIPSAINGCTVKESRDEIREKYGVPQDAFVISFAGRHNEIKGYSDLKKIGERLLGENVWFLIAGAETPIKGLKHPHWIEIGWTKDPHSIINAADIFVLPNRETYFDLVLLEALSLGQIVVASNTGGNKYFLRYSVPGILTYDNIDEAICKIKSVQNWNIQEVSLSKSQNKALFNRNFTMPVFYEQYKELLKRLLNEKEYAN